MSNQSPATAEHDAKAQTQRKVQRSRKMPLNIDTSSNRSPQTTRSSSRFMYKASNRDILSVVVKELELTDAKSGSYVDLFDRLQFDLTPFAWQGNTWYHCRGKDEDNSPCQRMIPEVYFRTTIEETLQAALQSKLRGDELVEELASALAYAICSQHHPSIHKIVRAIEAKDVVEEWRQGQRAATGSSLRRRETPTARSALPTPSISAILSDTVDYQRHNSRGAFQSIIESDEADEEREVDIMEAYERQERLKVEREYQAYLRASSRERQKHPE